LALNLAGAESAVLNQQRRKTSGDISLESMPSLGSQKTCASQATTDEDLKEILTSPA
jgi:hypothetical protein